MSASQRTSSTRTASTCTPETARSTHVFTITGYSLYKGLGADHFIRSSAFSVGGHDWCIRYCHDGKESCKHVDHVQVFLELLSKKTQVRARFDFRLVDQATGQSTAIHPKAAPVVLFDTVIHESDYCGTFSSKKKNKLEASPYLWDDRLIIECNVTVIIGEPRVEETTVTPEFEIPPSDLLDNLLTLLEEKKGSDVTFKVNDEVFPAHKIVLAMRSSVFNAELYGPIRENTRQCITIEDMHPDVFRALLHFIYTDSMPAMEDFEVDDSKDMIRHLLVAADRYAMERLKLICEDILCRSLDLRMWLPH